MNRRKAIKLIGLSTAGITLIPFPMMTTSCKNPSSILKISLAQWSLHRTFFGNIMQTHGWETFIKEITSGATLKGDRDPMDFAAIARNEYELDAVEYVNTFFYKKANDTKFLAELKQRADDVGVRNLLIMCDLEGALGDADTKERIKAVENHYKWIDAAKFLGCHSIRVNASSSGSYEEQQKRAIDGLQKLTEYSAKQNINVIIENHGGLSSNGQWLSSVIKGVDHKNCGTLPDFGNFNISDNESYDRYKGVAELLPFAKGLSAKSKVFDENGYEANTDYERMIKLVKENGYSGYIGIEYEGDQLSEKEGILATKALLERYL